MSSDSSHIYILATPLILVTLPLSRQVSYLHLCLGVHELEVSTEPDGLSSGCTTEDRDSAHLESISSAGKRLYEPLPNRDC